jgi:DtxR family Mn-dependent transcriptional regulator
MKSAMTSHLEDYLEAILFVSGSAGEAHASVVAERLGVTRASVTGALRALADRNLIIYHPYQPVILTEEGRKLAQACANRHRFLHRFFRDQLGMDDQEAEAVACRVEHVASDTVLSRMAEFSRYLAECNQVSLSWTPEGALLCSRGSKVEDCDGCSRRRPQVSD